MQYNPTQGTAPVPPARGFSHNVHISTTTTMNTNCVMCDYGVPVVIYYGGRPSDNLPTYQLKEPQEWPKSRHSPRVYLEPVHLSRRPPGGPRPVQTAYFLSPRRVAQWNRHKHRQYYRRGRR